MKRVTSSRLVVLLFPALAFCERIINGVRVLTTIDELVDPTHTAVIVVDMQNEILSSQGGYRRKDQSAEPDPQKHEVVPAYKGQVKGLAQFLQRAREMGVMVVYAEYIHRARNGRMLVNGPEYWTHRNSD